MTIDHYASLREGLVGAWCPSIAGSGFILPDLSGRGNHGTLTNMAADDWVSSRYGRSLDFDGINDYVESVNPLRNGMSQFSVSCWVARKADQHNKGIVSVLNDQGGNGVVQFIIFWSNFTSNLILFSSWNASNARVNVSSTFTLDLNRFYHIVGVCNGVTQLLYIDGILDGSSARSGPFAASTENFNIGAYGRSLCANSLIDDVRLYDRALTPSEIRLLASRPGIGLSPFIDVPSMPPIATSARRRRILTGAH